MFRLHATLFGSASPFINSSTLYFTQFPEHSGVKAHPFPYILECWSWPTPSFKTTLPRIPPSWSPTSSHARVCQASSAGAAAAAAAAVGVAGGANQTREGQRQAVVLMGAAP
ncbi:unnamed protein product [Closterium sp. Naga37s-1]|nr:unnamed protein product [Closterium sp. Naga37s-1]